jgi:AcrR family transcriptional regulator
MSTSKAPARPSQKLVVDKRAAIMRAALELFTERGFYGVAVPEIADRAGVGAGTIYRYFDSKDALVNVMYREEKQHFADLVLRAMPQKALNARELFHELWHHMAEFASTNEDAFIFLELQHHASYLDAESLAVERRLTDMFGAIIASAQSRGELKAGDPKLIMGIVMGAFCGVIRSCVETKIRAAQANWKFAEQCMWEAIRA